MKLDKLSLLGEVIPLGSCDANCWANLASYAYLGLFEGNLSLLSTSLDQYSPSRWFVPQGWVETGRQFVYDLSFVNIDKLDIVQTSWKAVWGFVFLEYQQYPLQSFCKSAMG